MRSIEVPNYQLAALNANCHIATPEVRVVRDGNG
jgi:hypothetical protein